MNIFEIFERISYKSATKSTFVLFHTNKWKSNMQQFQKRYLLSLLAMWDKLTIGINGYANETDVITNQTNDIEWFSTVIVLSLSCSSTRDLSAKRFWNLHFSRPTDNQYLFLFKYNSCIFFRALIINRKYIDSNRVSWCIFNLIKFLLNITEERVKEI